jgi:ABC-type bacteriocin/lantibiotic exporter with double-glycine peptidase domain
MRRLPVVLQTTASDCGPACLTMLLSAHGRPLRPAVVREALDPGRDGVTALDLRDVGAELGLPLRAVRVEPQLLASGGLEGLVLPAIAHWTGHHFVVVESARRARYQVIDPAAGRRSLDREAFLAGCTGLFLAPVSPPDGRRRGPRPRSERLALILPLLGRHRWAQGAIALASAVMAVLGLAIPLATATAVDQLAAGRTATGSLLVGVVGLAVLSALAALVRSAAVVSAQRGMSRGLAVDTVARLLGSPYRFFTRRQSGDLVARVSSAEIVRETLTTSLVTAVVDGFLLLSYLVIVTCAHPLLGALAGGLAGLQLGCATAVSRRTRLLRREEVIAEGYAVSRLEEAITGLPAVRTSGAESVLLDRWRSAHARQLDAVVARLRAVSVTEAMLTAARISSPVLLLLAAARWADGSPGRTIGLAVLAAAALAPIGTLATAVRSVQELGPLVDRISDVAQAPAEQAPGGRSVAAVRGEMRLAGAGFRYDRRSPVVLDSVDLTVPAGAKVAIVGPSGCGKSTLAQLFALLYPPTTGTVLVDGHDVRGLDLASVRRRFGVVLQEPFLIAGTIAENIALGCPEADQQDVVAAARLACVADEIEAMPLGYDTMLAERGAGLSGGQQQRIALARALVRRPAVLVLDEATSALDPATEAAVEANLRRLTMTRIVVSHRLGTVADADHVVLLAGGRVVEQGTPEDLMALDGGFRRLVETDRARSDPVLTGQ